MINLNNREEVIKALWEIGDELAQEMSFTKKEFSKDTNHGVWGPRIVEHMEQKHGDCSTVIKWTGEDEDEYIRFRFRFSSPCLGVHLSHEVFAEIQLSDYNPATKEFDAPFHFGEADIWKDGGIKLFQRLYDKWLEKLQ